MEQQASEHHLNVDTPDTAPTEDEPAAQRKTAGRAAAHQNWGGNIGRRCTASLTN